MKHIQTIKPPVPSVELIRPGLYKRLGYTDAQQKIPRDIEKQIQKALELAMKLANPKGIFLITPLEEIGGKMIQGKGIRIESKKWAKVAGLMESAEIMLVYAVTLGRSLDIKVTSVQKQSLSLGYILDAAGSEIVERVSEGLGKKLWKELNLDKYKRSARFSPGYCDWPLYGQEAIFALLMPEKIGIHHTKAWAMLPSKSITSVMLGARKMQLRSPCPLCSQKTCPYRREHV